MNRIYRDRDFEFTNGKWQAHTFILLFTKSPTMFQCNKKTMLEKHCTLTIIRGKGIRLSRFSLCLRWHMKLEAASYIGKTWNTKHCSYSFYHIDNNTIRNFTNFMAANCKMFIRFGPFFDVVLFIFILLLTNYEKGI